MEMDMSNTAKPSEDVEVLTLSQILAMPFATQMLG
jgi:crotonobetainyl-CoA:carnitine CoA-transferase CaiB-like acyl-CoA transferase